MSEKLGIPYMGSKRKLASEILSKLTQRHENVTDFYDLFGGGGSISFTAIRDYRFNVHYNELNKHIFSLVEYLKNNKSLEPKFYEWVTREQFFEQCAKTNEEADWYSGFVMSCFSFGNNQKGYIYSKDIEELKRLSHQFIVFGCIDSMNELGVELSDILKFKDIQKRRILFCKEIEKTNSIQSRVENLERLNMMESLSRIQNLQNLQNLKNLQNLQITNKSYEKVLITGENPIIYCDIPYKGTGEYKEGGFDHEKFYQWFSNLDYPAYLSEYDAPFEKIEMFKHRSSLSATNNKKKVFESIYWNGKGNIIKNTLF